MTESVPARPTGGAYGGQFALASYLKLVVPGVLIWLALVWLWAVQPEMDRARYEKVETRMTLAEVRHLLGPPLREDRARALGWHGELVWEYGGEYGHARIVFDAGGHVISKSADFSFD